MSAGDRSAEIARVGQLSFEQLRAEWVRRFGAEPPKLRTRDLMARALTYRLQVRAHGDLPGPAKRRMAELARKFAADRSYTPVQGPQLKPGCSLVKDYRGVRHEVFVVEGGFSYRGEVMGSLSEVAKRITGTKWNGHVFFGLKARK